MKDLHWQLPYSSHRMPVLAANVVSTSQPLAAQAGLEMLRKGGNAVDAALAAAITLTVVEPTMNGIGGDAFALVWDGEKLHGLNASGRAPAAWHPQRFAGHDAMPKMGWEAVTVPGQVAGWVALSEQFGKLPFAELFEPAIAYARSGFPVSPTVARQWRNDVANFSHIDGYADAFMLNGRAPQAGEWFACADQARSLELIARTNGDAFYRGELAEKMVKHCRAHCGAMTMEDLDAHRADWVNPMSHGYRDHTLHEVPPNSQGLAVHVALGILEQSEIGTFAPDSVDSLHLQMEALKLAFAEIYRHVGDPSAMRIDPAQLLDPEHLTRLARKIDMLRAQFPGFEELPKGDTVYLTTADAAGMMVSYIQSNYFASGIVVPGTGISMQGRGAGFTLQPGHPNEVGGTKRPFHTIIPAFVTQGGKPLMTLGIVGTTLQPQGQTQLIVRMVDHGVNPQAACDAPRFRLADGATVLLERGFAPSVLEELTRRGHHPRYGDTLDFGCAQLLRRLDRGYFAASDPRRDGQAVGF